MRHLGLFEGINGFSLAARWMGWETVGWCEINEFCQHVLRHDFPEAIGHSDITQTDFTQYANRIDIITGGFPCQPYSTAGKRLGTADNRHLWPEMLRAIREVKPAWVVGENVRGLISWNGGMVFDQVQADMEAQGYEVLPFLLPAAGVGAPHRRDRIWFIAHRADTGLKGLRSGRENTVYEPELITNAYDWIGPEYGLCTRRNVPKERLEKIGATPDTQNIRRKFTGDSRAGRSGSEDSNSNGIPSDSKRIRQQGPGRPVNTSCKKEDGNWKASWSHNEGGWPTQPPVCNGDDGLSSESLRQRIREDCMGIISEKEIDKILSKAYTAWRNESIQAGGNAIVPQVALQIFKSINHFNTNNYEQQ